MIAFLVLVHDHPRQALALVESLRSPQARTFIHVDAKTDIGPFQQCAEAGAILIEERKNVHWGGFSQVRATLALIRAALRHEISFTHFALLSGSDYPIATADAIAGYAATQDREFIDAEPVEEGPDSLPWQRMLKYQLEGGWRGAGLRGRIIRELNAHILSRLPDRDVRAIAGPIDFYRGGAYWILTREAVEDIFSFSQKHKSIVRLLSHSVCSDETFFHTAVKAGPRAARVAGTSTYSQWLPGSSGPSVVDDGLVDIVTAPGFHLDGGGGGARPALFVRKLNGDDDHIRARLDHYRTARVLPTERLPHMEG
ncbi:beta-1,6-N-acetylglucosaminyltransferase [Mesorhizobium sp.]|uniref:beta-1,6-N-acetylglucosaminyltransferase n=1 Tax=Mesorhizobium sp. TaxID=1871066 RepID=UPI003BAB80E5